MSGKNTILHVTVVTERQTSKKSFEVDSVVVGRNPDCLLSVSHHDVSRRHLTLWVRGEEIWIEDLGSSNGTFINGARLVPHSPQAFFPTDKISVGASTGIFLSAELEIRAPSTESPLSEEAPPSDHAETVIFAPPKNTEPESRPEPDVPSFPTFEPSSSPAFSPQPQPTPASIRKPAPAVVPATEQVVPALAARPKSPAQHIEINRLLQDAKREAEEILRMARLEAEHKVQEIYERAENTQKEAENFYHQRMQEAYRSAEEAYADAKAEAETLLEKTRRACDEIRRQTNTSTSEIRSRTRKECDVLLREAEAQARLLKESRQQEAEAALARREEQLIAEIRESMALSQKELQDRIADESRLHEERLFRERAAHEDRLNQELSAHQEKLVTEAKTQADRLSRESEEHRDRIATALSAHEERLSGEKAVHEERLARESETHEERLRAEVSKQQERLKAEASAQAEELAKEKARFEEETAELRAEHASLTKDTGLLSSRKDELEASVRKYKKENEELETRGKELSERKNAAAAELEAVGKEKAGVTDELEKKKRAFEELSHQFKELTVRKESASREIEAELLQLRTKLETAKAKMKKEEEEQLVYLKLETAKRVQQTEKELLSEIARKKNAFVKEILVSLEKSSSVIASKVSEWRKETPGIEENLLGLIDGQLFAMKVEGVSAPQKIDLGAQRRRERMQHIGFGATVGMLVLFLGLQALNRLKGPSPLERAVASEAEARQKDLEKRKFNPPKAPAWKDDYVDAVIYTDRFVELTTSDEYQKKWSLAASKHLLKLWKVDEDSSLQVVSIANALVKSLADRKERIHPDYIKDGLRKMKDAEEEAVKRMSNLLGSQVRFESLKKFEKEFFLAYRESHSP